MDLLLTSGTQEIIRRYVMSNEYARIKTKRVLIELVVEEETAIWIKSIVQNPLIEDESPKDKAMREKLFTILDCLV